MRILINALHARSGGGITYLNNMLPLLADDPELDIHVCLHENQRELLNTDTRKVTFHYLGFPYGFVRVLWREQFDIPRLSRKIAADVVFSPANFGPLLIRNGVIMLRNALGVGLVERRLGKIIYWIVLYKATTASLIMCKRAITVSNYAKSQAGGFMAGPLSNRIRVIPHGKSDLFCPPPGGSEREDFLLSVSDIYVQKNMLNLIEALSMVREAHPNIKLKIAGRPVDQDYYQSLKALISRKRLEDNVEFLGEVPAEQLVPLYQQCRGFVFPSTVETFGNPLVEAMACGAPVACSGTAAMPEVTDDAALFFDPQNPSDIAAKLLTLINEDTSALSRKSIHRGNQFSWQKTKDQTVAVFKEIN